MIDRHNKAVWPMVVGALTLVGAYYAVQLAIYLASLWMLIFGSVVFAVILRSIADPLVRHAKLKDGLAVLVSVLAIVLLVAAVSTFFGREITLQLEELSGRVPAAWELVRARVAASPFGDDVIGMVSSLASQAGRALAIAQKVAMGAISGVTTMVLVLVAGVFLAIRPVDSREGVLAMAPLGARPRLREVMNA